MHLTSDAITGIIPGSIRERQVYLMMRDWLGWMSTGLIGIGVVLLLGAGVMLYSRSGEILVPEVVPKGISLPKNPFRQPEAAYEAIGDPFPKLSFVPLSMQLPDLKKELVYYGKNERPDAPEEGVDLHLGIARGRVVESIAPGKRLYLQYDGKQYLFSPKNAETSLWVEVIPKGKNVEVQVAMRGPEGEVVTEPKERAQFSLRPKPPTRSGRSQWELGGSRVDGTLLARQRGRWYGEDLFMQQHGGEEYAAIAEKQRIDFGEKADRYAVFVGPESALIWKGERWEEAAPGKETETYPLLEMKRVDGRVMNFELWDVGGKQKVPLNLIKSTEAWMPKNILRNFKFMGSRTRSQFVFEIDGERTLLSPQDWLVMTDDGWKKITTPEEVDDYVAGKLAGVLLIFHGLDRTRSQQTLTGTLYNKSRSAARDVEMNIQQGGTTFDLKEEAKESNKRERPARAVVRDAEDEDDVDEDDNDNTLDEE